MLEEIGTVKLNDTSVNGLWKLNYATRNPPEADGTLIERNEPQHNRPIHVPLRGDAFEMSNVDDYFVGRMKGVIILDQMVSDLEFIGMTDYLNA